MSVLRKEWSLHTTAGAVPLLEGSSWGFDRSWAPQGAGTAVLPLNDPASAAIVENSRQPLRIVADLWHTMPPGTLGTGSMPGTKLGDAAWPMEDVPRYPGSMLDPVGDPITHLRRAWHCWPLRLTRDHKARQLRIELATIELLLVETLNGSDPWKPTPTGPGGTYLLSDMLAQLLAYIGVPLTVFASAATVPAEKVLLWEPGESAWDWFNAMRIAAERSYRYDPTRNTIRFVGIGESAIGEVSTDWLEYADELGGAGETDLARYADALLIVWQWTDPVTGEEREQREIALAPGVHTWQQARQMQRLEVRSQPQAGMADRWVRQRVRWRNLATVTTPLDESTLVDLLTGRGQTAQSIRFAIGEELTVTFSLITEA